MHANHHTVYTTYLNMYPLSKWSHIMFGCDIIFQPTHRFSTQFLGPPASSWAACAIVGWRPEKLLSYKACQWTRTTHTACHVHRLLWGHNWRNTTGSFLLGQVGVRCLSSQETHAHISVWSGFHVYSDPGHHGPTMMFFHYDSLVRRTLIDGKVFTSLTLREKKNAKNQSSEAGQGSMQHTVRMALGDITDDGAGREDMIVKRRKMT